MDKPVDDENEELDKEFERIVAMHEKLGKKIDSVYENAQLAPKELEAVLNNPSLFPEGQWKLIEKERKVWDEEFWRLAGEEARKRAAKRKKKKSSTSKRGRKFRGKRRNWLQMD